MKTKAAFAIIGVLLIVAALLLLYSCGGGGSTTASDSAALSAGSDGASGALGGDTATGGNTDVSPTNVAPTDVAPTDVAPADAAPGTTDVTPTDAAGDSSAEGNTGDQQRRWHRRGRPVFGTITAFEDQVMVLKPEIPDFIAQRIREHLQNDGNSTDRPDPPALPDEVRLLLTADTVYKQGGEVKDGNPFVVGDEVVAWAGVSDTTDMRVARMVADLATFQERWQNWQSGDHQGDWQSRFGRMMPGYGEITEFSDTSITIKPELPQWVKDHMPADAPAPQLPDSMTFLINADTKFFQNGEQVRPNAFAVGDTVFIMPVRPDDSTAATDAPIAKFVSDSPMWRHRQNGDGTASGDTFRQRMRNHWGGMGGDGMMGGG